LSEEGQDSDRSERASAFKLKRARDRGAVARGFDIGFAASIGVFAAWLWLAGGASTEAIERAAARLLSDAGVDGVLSAGAVTAAIGTIFAPLFGLFAILFGTSLAIDFLQVGPVFTTHPLTPDFGKLNPAKGLRRIFALRSLIEAGKGVLKLAAYGAVVYIVLWRLIESDLALLTDARSAATILWSLTLRLLFSVLAIAIVFAIVDQLLTRRLFAGQMRMSMREVRREHREREGDPRV
jgi:flagellar biosynthesis protein FlhB